jgi:type II secretory pathway pseudopilin PulG
MRITSDSFPTIKIGIVGAMILIIVAITVPSLLRAGGAEREASTIGTLKMLNMACAEYSATFTQYPAALSDLQKGQNGGLSSTAADLIDSSLATGTKDGYVFTYVRGEGGAGYSITARPAKAHQTEARHFFTDQSGTIRFAIGQDADVSGAPVQ